MASLFLGDFKKLSPIQLSYNLLLRCGLMNQEGRPWTQIIVTYHGILLTLFGIFCGVETYMVMDDFNEMVQPCVICIADIHMLGKFVNILLNQSKVRNLLNRLEQLRQQELEDPVYASQITKVDNFTKTLIYHLNLYFHLLPVVTSIFNVINDNLSATEKPSLALPMWMPWNYQKSWPYVAAIITSALIVLTAITLFATFYSLLLTITFQISTMLKILQVKMEVNRVNDKNIFQQHINILQILQQVNEVFSGQYYLEILLSSVQPCGFCYMLIKNLKAGDSRWLDLLYKLMYALGAPLMLCACGEEINSQVEKLHESSYRSSWYQEQPTARKELLILMTVTSRPLKFGYKGLITFNLMCYATVLQAFYSYITMLINLQTND